MITSTKMQLWYPKQVVDARAGPGMKSMTKFKSKIKKGIMDSEKIKKKKHRFEREYSPTPSDKSDGNEDAEMAEVDFLSEDGPSGGSSRTASPGVSDCEDLVIEKGRRHKTVPKKRNNYAEVNDFIDHSYWTREVICCGTIYRGQYGEVMSDPRRLRPCTALSSKCSINNGSKVQQQPQPTSDTAKDNHLPTTSATTTDSTPPKTFSDSSSDSGYDESSNQGTNPDNLFKKERISIEQLNRQLSKIN